MVALTVAFENGCHYCMAMHSALLARDPAAAPIVAALREGEALPDARLEAVHRLARAVLRERGHVEERELRAFEAAGFGEQEALDVVLGVGVYVLSTLSNVVTGAELDAPFSAFQWEKPAA